MGSTFCSTIGLGVRDDSGLEEESTNTNLDTWGRSMGMGLMRKEY